MNLQIDLDEASSWYRQTLALEHAVLVQGGHNEDIVHAAQAAKTAYNRALCTLDPKLIPRNWTYEFGIIYSLLDTLAESHPNFFHDRPVSSSFDKDPLLPDNKKSKPGVICQIQCRLGVLEEIIHAYGPMQTYREYMAREALPILL